jgi:cysteine-rich CPXCG protein
MFDPNDIEDNDEPGNVRAFPQDVVLDTEAEVACPSCGEKVVIGLDPDGGATQEYVEDCQVCCRPWRVRVRYDETGAAEVVVEDAQ